MKIEEAITQIEHRINIKKGEISRLVQVKQILQDLLNNVLDPFTITGTPEEVSKTLVVYNSSHVGRPTVVNEEILRTIMESPLPSRQLSEQFKKQGKTISPNTITNYRKKYTHFRNRPTNRPTCPHCLDTTVISKGFVTKNNKRYRTWLCKKCNKRFIET